MESIRRSFAGAPFLYDVRRRRPKSGKRGTNYPLPLRLKGGISRLLRALPRLRKKEKYMSRVSFEHFGGKERRLMWSRKDEEYAADFHLVSRRALDPFHYRVFSYHFLLGADWKLCCRRLGIDRGRFFHAVYRVQEALGRVFYELEPYGLYPPREYFTTRLTQPETPRGAAAQWLPGRAPSGPASGSGSSGQLRRQSGGGQWARPRAGSPPEGPGRRSAWAVPRPGAFVPLAIPLAAPCSPGA